jgi:hypothetical protein
VNLKAGIIGLFGSRHLLSSESEFRSLPIHWSGSKVLTRRFDELATATDARFKCNVANKEIGEIN